MPAFTSTTELFNYFRYHAQEFGCKLCFDDKQAEIEQMNERGSNGTPGCLCKVNSPCPCKGAAKEIETDGMCYCEIFMRK